MSSITQITPQEKLQLKDLHQQLENSAKLGGYSAAAASFLLIGALIVITCGSLCIMLPGVNVLSHVIFPAIIPGALSILVSIPFILSAVKHSMDNTACREEMLNFMMAYLVRYRVPEMKDKDDQVKFIQKNLLDWDEDPTDPEELKKNVNRSNEYQSKLLGDLKDKLGEDKKNYNLGQKKIAKALDKAREALTQK